MSAATVQSSANLFRRLAWNTTIPLEIRLADGEPGAGSGVDKYYIQASRYTYLPLLIPEIRENLVELALDDQQLADTNEANWWFEEWTGDDERQVVSQGPCRWHWPIDLIDLHSTISRPTPASSSTSNSSVPQRPLQLALHLSNPPADKLMVSGSIEACKTQFVNQVKEADFVRWGNTKKVTGLRRIDLEAGWDGVVAGDFELHSRMAVRIVPLPIPISTASTPSQTPGVPSRPASADPSSNASAKQDSVYSTRSLPIKIYLPDGAPALQEIVPPMSSNGNPTTLMMLLNTHLPLLFPPTSKSPYTLAQPMAQGIVLPAESEVAWLTACMAGADGWLRIGIRLVSE